MQRQSNVRETSEKRQRTGRHQLRTVIFFKEQTEDLPLTIPSLGKINVWIKTNHKPMTTLGH